MIGKKISMDNPAFRYVKPMVEKKGLLPKDVFSKMVKTFEQQYGEYTEEKLLEVYSNYEKMKEEKREEFRLARNKAMSRYLDSEEKIIDFVILWKNHFINTMHPKFLPENFL